MIKYCAVLIAYLVNQITFGQEVDYSVALIPDSLKVNANAVIRDESVTFTYLSLQKSKAIIHKVITILNKNGDKNASFLIPYDKFTTVTSIKANVFDANGKLIRKSKASDIIDRPYSTTYLEFSDSRYKMLTPIGSQYPYTMEYITEVSFDGSWYFPDITPPGEYNVSIQKASVRILVPENYKINYKAFNMPERYPVITGNVGMSKEYYWEVNSVKSFDYEPFIDRLLYKYFPCVYTEPSEFSMGSFPGKFNTWDDYNSWMLNLLKNRDELPADKIAEIKEMVKNAATEKEKIKILYQYLQNHTRYFGIQLGIGGNQPMAASRVAELGYSDCKGLSNYMKAILKAVGIESYYTLVESGSYFPQIIPDLVYDPFDHIILCVPLKNDTVWLECTSQIMPFNFLGDFTSDRHVLLIKETGGELVKTPAYTMAENFQYTHALVNIGSDGNGKAEIHRHFGGLQFDDKVDKLKSNTNEQRDWLYTYFNMPNYKLLNYTFKADDYGKPLSYLSSSVDLVNYAPISGKRLFLPLNLSNRFTETPAKVKNRLTDICFPYAFIDADTVEYLIPDGMAIEFLPEEKNIVTIFGEYSAKVIQKENSIVYIRQIKMPKGTYPKEKYNDFVKFFYDMTVADKSQAILIKKDS